MYIQFSSMLLLYRLTALNVLQDFSVLAWSAQMLTK